MLANLEPLKFSFFSHGKAQPETSPLSWLPGLQFVNVSILYKAGFDGHVERLCAPFYAERTGVERKRLKRHGS
jgi:hypothetical protein